MAKVKLAGKNALITGGARGIGKATARLFQAEGATLILIDCDESALKATQAELGEDTFAFVCDVSKPDSVKRAMDDTRRAVGELHILFANAGIAHCPPLPQTGEAFFDHIMGVKVKGVFFSFLHALPILARDSSAIFTSSSAADRGRPGDVLYSASKAAVRSLARCFAGHEDVLEKKIRVNVLAPRPIRTELTRKAWEMAEANAWIESLIPLGRWGMPEEVARAALFLASDDSSYLTGSVIAVDGGLGQV